jgi:hypothetical protein
MVAMKDVTGGMTGWCFKLAAQAKEHFPSTLGQMGKLACLGENPWVWNTFGVPGATDT